MQQATDIAGEREGVMSLTVMDHPREGALRRRRERESERRASETPEQREARLSQRRLRDRGWARQRRATEAAEEREARPARGRVRSRARRGTESEETIRPGSNSFKAIRHAKFLPSQATQKSGAENCCRVQRGERGPPTAAMQKSGAENCCRVQRGERGSSAAVTT